MSFHGALRKAEERRLNCDICNGTITIMQNYREVKLCIRHEAKVEERVFEISKQIYLEEAKKGSQ